jgi:uroporphyrin-III C-methyltransferase
MPFDGGVVRPILRGKVWLVGAGPGDPELLTVKAHRLLARAEVVAYDELVPQEILDLAPASAERIAVGRRARGCRHHEGKIHALVIERALEGKEVVRLKGGDPFIFGRGGEEAEELAEARVPFEVVPGISAALGAASTTHIPLTHREAAASVTFATAHFAGDVEDDDKLAAQFPKSGTLVLYMGLSRVSETMAALARSGRGTETPVAIVSRATRPDQRVVTGTIGTIADIAKAEAIETPALVVVGEVVARAVASPKQVADLLGDRDLAVSAIG